MAIAKINEQTYKLLYDTGSCITCMSLEMLQKLRSQNIQIKNIKTSNKNFTSANGGKMTSIGLFKIPMIIEGKSVSPTFQVLPKLHENFILGIDFITEEGLQLCLKHQKFHWNEQCPLEHGKQLEQVTEV